MTDLKFDNLAATLCAGEAAPHCLSLRFIDCDIVLRSNNSQLLDALADYFHTQVTSTVSPQVIELLLIDGQSVEPPLPVFDWPRAAGTQRKEAVAELRDGRLIHKVRTGVLFVQGYDRGLAIGPLLANTNQVINFINNQTIGLWKRNGWQICHASALLGDRGVVAFAGLSGGGKSTLALHLMNASPSRFVSNDRLLVRTDQGVAQARGIAKAPRVNPGTLLNNRSLIEVLPSHRRRALATLDRDALWALEEKYDVMIERAFGPNRQAEHGALNAVVILDWHRNSQEPTQLTVSSFADAPELLGALMKSPGPFYLPTKNHASPASEDTDPTCYLEALAPATVYRLSGRADFDVAVALCLPLLTRD